MRLPQVFIINRMITRRYSEANPVGGGYFGVEVEIAAELELSRP